jgi:predicted transcriptional regulator
MSPKLETILRQVPSWPAEDQEELTEAAREIAARRSGIYPLDQDEERAVREGIAQLDRGEAVNEEEMRSFWKRCGIL